MPYKDLRWKGEWEQQHRSQRLARRRELRRIEATQSEAQPEALSADIFQEVVEIWLAGEAFLRQAYVGMQDQRSGIDSTSRAQKG